jgi:putative salt-induced outer membrane protein
MQKFLQRMRSVLITAVVLTAALGWADASCAEEFLDGWNGSIFAGYNHLSGNTDKAAGSINVEATKKFELSEILLKGNVFYSQSDKKMDGQKWDALAKYSYDYGADLQWYNFIQVLADHDYFSDIDYRVTPAVGVGYHIARTEEWTWDADAGLGYRITRHRVNTQADDEAATIVLHTLMRKKIFDNAYISEDLTVYPGLESGSGVLVRSETAFVNPLSANLDFELKYIYDFNSEPAQGMNKADRQIVAGIRYKF